MKSADGFDAGIDGAAYFGFALGVGRIVSVIGVANQFVLEAEGVESFGDAGSE